jgi:hypothetical protein
LWREVVNEVRVARVVFHLVRQQIVVVGVTRHCPRPFGVQAKLGGDGRGRRASGGVKAKGWKKHGRAAAVITTATAAAAAAAAVEAEGDVS